MATETVKIQKLSRTADYRTWASDVRAEMPTSIGFRAVNLTVWRVGLTLINILKLR